MTQLILIRGLPGSGKSTLAKKRYVSQGYLHFEADMYFSYPFPDGDEYRFKPAHLPAAHEWCRNKAAMWLGMGNNVVVSNTFTRLWEMEPYLDMGFPTHVIKCVGNYPNIHGVPDHAIRKMRERWEDYENEMEWSA